MKVIKNNILQGKHQKSILVDVFYTETNTKKPVLIFCHGYKGYKDWGAWNIMAAAFAKAGFFFVKFNFSHNGGTVEQPIDFPDLEAFGNNNYTKELDDLETVIDWILVNSDVSNEINVDQLSLMGHSRARGIVAIKAAEDNRIFKVITLAGVSDYKKRTATISELEQWKKDGVKYVLNGRTKQQMPHYYQFFEDFIKNEKRLTIKRAVENITIPMLIIHGSNDTSISIEEAKNLYQWSSNGQLKIIENANHVFGTKHPWEKEELSKDLRKAVAFCIDFLKK